MTAQGCECAGCAGPIPLNATTTYTLMGPYDNFASTTGFSNWDISFLPCGGPVFPDPLASGGNFNDQWTNLQQWAFFTNYTGSYYPYIACLEDFNLGSAMMEVWDVVIVMRMRVIFR